MAAYWMNRSAELDLKHADVADPYILNQVIWFSARGEGIRMPALARLPLFDVMREGVADTDDDEREKPLKANNSANDKKRESDED